VLDISLPAVSGHQIHRGTLQYQNLRPRKGLFHLQSTSIQLCDDAQPFQMPSFERECNLPSNLEDFVEERFKQYTDSTNPLQYLVAAAHIPDSRKRLGLPEAVMQADTRLLSTKKHFPGIHSSYAYISASTGSLFSAHVEDFYLRSVNVFYMGEPKIWIIVQSQHKDKLEAQIVKHLNLQRPKCSQFVRQQNIVLPPSILRKWAIDFELVVQCTLGDTVYTDSSEYHWGFNVGANVAEAVNFSGPEWLVPPLYRECSKRYGCGDQQPMTISDMEIDVYRELDVMDFEEPEAAVLEKKDDTTLCSQRTRAQTKQLSATSVKVERSSRGASSFPQLTANKEGSDVTASSYAKKAAAIRKGSFRKKTSKHHGPPSEIAIRKSTRIEGSNLARLEVEGDINGDSTYQKDDLVGEDDINGEPTYQEDDLVGEINWWIWFAVEHHDLFMWPTGAHPSASELKHDLMAFEPTKQSPKEAWLNDVVVSNLLWQLAMADQTVSIIDSLMFTNAFRKRNASTLGPVGVSTRLVLAPINTGTHWYLIAANVFDRMIVIYDDGGDEYAEFLAEFLELTIRGAIGWQRRHEKVS
jgi:JmjC domain, hydroxylase